VANFKLTLTPSLPSTKIVSKRTRNSYKSFRNTPYDYRAQWKTNFLENSLFGLGGQFQRRYFFGRNMHAVCHHVLAKIDPDQIDCLGEAARQPPAGFQPLAGKN